MTKKALRAIYGDDIIRLSFAQGCALGLSTVTAEKVGENTGLYGWNWSAYDIHGAAVVMGDHDLPRGTVPPTGLVERFAARIRGGEPVRAVLHEFVEAVRREAAR